MPELRYISYKKSLYINLLKNGFKRLRFKHGLEQDFSNFYNQKYKRAMTISVLIAMIIFGLSGLFDIFFAPNVMLLQIIRFLIILPIVLIIYLLMITTDKFNHLLQYFLIAVILLIAIGTLSIGLLQPNPMRDMYFNGVLLILIFAFILSRLQFWKALVTSVILFIMLITGIYYDNFATTYIFLGHSFIFLAAVFILGVSSYTLEKSIRINYLQTSLLNIEQEELKDAKKHLEKLSTIDGLTGIANHRHFHEILKMSWNHSMRSKEKLALLIIDVDYFKQYNDLYGHQAGDECLKLVADALNKSVRRSSDLTARYGGDEFIVLLNDTNSKSLKKVIQNIYKNISELKLKHEYNRYQVLTVSIGATITRPRSETSANDFIAVADYALYQAKRQGRNQSVIVSNDRIPEYQKAKLRKNTPKDVGKPVKK